MTLPLPTGPRHVHCYVIDGTLFDTGLGLEPPPWRELEIERIAITHFHPDHVGGAEQAARETGAPVHQGALDYAQCERVWGSDDWPERIAEWFLVHGVRDEIALELIEAGHAFASFVRFAHDPNLLYEGSELDGWSVLELPGHADGHIGFLRDGVLVGGDHLLARITPAVGLYLESRPDPLGDYLASLERTAELDLHIVTRVTASRSRSRREGARDHRAPPRAADVVEPRSRDGPAAATSVSKAVFGAELPPQQRRFAVAEALSHLERLVREGRAARSGDAGNVTYTAP